MTHVDPTDEANCPKPCPPGEENHGEADSLADPVAKEALKQELLREALEFDDFQDRIALISDHTDP